MRSIFSRVINVIILAIILTYIAAMKMKCGYCTDIPETGYVTTLSTIILVHVIPLPLYWKNERIAVSPVF